jgi:hypothetical protein
VINTAENGAARSTRASERPPHHRLVQPAEPRPRPGADHEHVEPEVDAYLWSTARATRSRARAGRSPWYPPRALSYASYATSWEAPPPGTKNGFKVRR